MQHNVCIDAQQWVRKPKQEEAGKISFQLARQQQSVSIHKLAQKLGNGHTWSPSTFGAYAHPKYGQQDQYRHASAFKASSLLAVDIDSGNKVLSELLAIGEAEGLQIAIIHESFSSGQGNRKWRVICPLDEPIVDAGQLLSLLSYACGIFAGDPACVDVARMLYGTVPAKMSYVDAKADNSAERLLEQTEPIVPHKRIAKQGITQAEQRARLEKLTIGEARLLKLVYGDMQRLIADPVGEAGSGYEACWNASRKLAQFSCLADETIMGWISIEQTKHPAIWADWRHSLQDVVASGISYGRANSRL